jgi:hypothetical protein
VDILDLLFGLANGGYRGSIVRIRADEEIVVGVAIGRDIVLHHLLYDAALFPQRNKNSDALLRYGIEFGFGRPVKLSAGGAPRGQPGACARDFQHQIVQAV